MANALPLLLSPIPARHASNCVVYNLISSESNARKVFVTTSVYEALQRKHSIPKLPMIQRRSTSLCKIKILRRISTSVLPTWRGEMSAQNSSIQNTPLHRNEMVFNIIKFYINSRHPLAYSMPSMPTSQQRCLPPPPPPPKKKTSSSAT